MDSKKALGLKLRKARLAKGMTQAKLAKCAGMTQDWVCSIERGHRRPDLCTVLHMAEALEMSLDELVGKTIK